MISIMPFLAHNGFSKKRLFENIDNTLMAKPFLTLANSNV